MKRRSPYVHLGSVREKQRKVSWAERFGFVVVEPGGDRLENLRSDVLMGLKWPSQGHSTTSAPQSCVPGRRADVNDWRT